ncbi:hypothetical protein KM176_06365 [Pseudooceanicola sp. CBS1P-1]|uniref:Uncharacterized protein n=1 Tax=Pseudooceanicola albus TaxID=2692189 RepID=A0A6L7G0W7_9RHOB|nr:MULTISPECIES: hypothetical protein [Pseudooceanicola]MBT9383475.1 hypothetical protein [Pseudooceanicola endophyticus]MXN16203.1 hypothetical protein [Pseudooceanicola albus]
MPHDLFSHMFKSLVQQVGGVDAAQAAISAAVGHQVSIGTVSKIANGHAEVPLSWAYALEDASGNRCFHAHRARSVAHDEAEASVGSHLDHLREATEMVEAMAHAESGPTRETLIRARKETADVVDRAGRALAAYDAMLEDAKLLVISGRSGGSV